MPHLLKQRVAHVARKAWLYSLVWGLGIVVSCAVVLVTAAAALDYTLRLQDSGLRFLLSAGVVAVVGWLFWKFSYSRISAEVSQQLVAERIERLEPALRGELTSALEFLDHPESDPRAGSAVLRRAVVSRTESAAENVDFQRVLRRKPALFSGWLAGVLLMLLVAFCVWRPETARIAFGRLANPFSSVTWPRGSNLAWSDAVTHVPRGGSLDLEVIDQRGAPLPDSAQAELRYGGEGGKIERVPLRFVGKSLRFRKDEIIRPFEYRAIGGDDDTMAWTPLDVVEPPEVQSLALELHPPAYTHWPVRTATGRIEALQGTAVALHGTSTKKLRAADVVLLDGARIPATIAADGYRFDIQIPATRANSAQDVEVTSAETGGSLLAAPFTVQASGSYQLQLVDEDGYESVDQARYEIRAIRDEPPRVNIDEPGGDLVATPQGAVPLRVTASDDLALRDVELRFARSDQSEAGNLGFSLYERNEPLPQLTEWPASNTTAESRELTSRWELAELRLPPGARVTFHAVAGDFAGQTGQSLSRRMIIVTPEQLLERLAEDQAIVVDELARVLDSQTTSRSHVSNVQLQLQNVGQLRAQDVDTLQAAELTQRNVERDLLDETTGVRRRVQRLLDMMTNNRIDSPDLTRRMQQILDSIDLIGRRDLPQANAALIQAVKDAQFAAGENSASDPRLAADVQSAATAQERAIAELQRTLGELATWNNYRRFFRDLGQIRQDQTQLTRDLAELPAANLGKSRNELTPQEQSDLARLQARHDDLARRLEALQGQMQPTIDSLRDSDPIAADVLSDTLNLAMRNALGQQLRSAGSEVQQNRVSKALGNHQQIADALQEMLDVLANKREHELARLAKKLEEAAADLQGLQQRQAGLRKQMEEAAANPNPEERTKQLERLAKEQRELQAEAERLGRRLERLQSQRAQASSNSAARNMASAADSAQSGDTQSSQNSQDDAQRDLEDARRQVAEDRKRVEADLAEELVAKSLDALRGIRDRQAALLEEGQRLAALRSSSGAFTPGQAQSLRDLARDQQSLATESRTLAERLQVAPAFAVALLGAADQMDVAVTALEAREPAAAADRQTGALRRLDQLLQAMQPSQRGANANQQNSDGNSSNSSGGSQDGIPRIAQYRLLKALQMSLNEETQQLDAELQQLAQRGGSMTAAQRARFAALSREQGRLADLILELSRPQADDPLKDLQDNPGSNNPGNDAPGNGGSP